MGASVTPWEARLGVTQGRIAPAGVTPSDGTWALVLGDDEGRTFDIESGDYADATQSLDLTGIDVIRIGQLVLRNEDSTVGDWTIVLYVDGVQIDAIQPRKSTVFTGIGIDVSPFSGVHDVTIRLVVA